MAEKVWKGWENIAQKHGIAIDIGGFKPMIHFAFKKDNNINRAFYTQEMLKRGFLAGTGFYSMYAHTAEQVDKYLITTDEVFGILAQHQTDDSVSRHLVGKPAVSGFGRIN
jgi:glutamate-1-semialdehyde 2,1-aminomutase